MRKVLVVLSVIFSAALLWSCGGGGSDSNSGTSASNITTAEALVDSGEGLVDLGDLVLPRGDRWYSTKAVGIIDNGMVIGSSNHNGQTSRGAFLWNPETRAMTFLGIDPDLIFSEAVDGNSKGEVIVNSYGSRGAEDPLCLIPYAESAALWRDGLFVPLPDGPRVSNDINEKGEMVGRADILETSLDAEGKEVKKCVPSAFYWDGKSANLRIVGSIAEAEYSEAIAINENSQIIINSGGTVVFHDLNHNVVESLNHLPGAVNTVAVDINDSIYTNNDAIPDGHVIGNSGDFLPDELWKTIMGQQGLSAVVQLDDPPAVEGPTPQPNGNPSYLDIILGTQPPGTAVDFLYKSSELDGVVTKLPAGKVIDESFSWTPNGGVQYVNGFFWDGGAMYPISGFGTGFSAVTDINNRDQVVGGAITSSGKTHAFMWTLNADGKGVVRDLGTLGGQHSFALAINEAGQIVGWSTTGEYYTEEGLYLPIIHGFLWEDGRMYDLGTHNNFYNYPFTPSYPFSVAVDINENGELTGNSFTINAHSRGFYSDMGF